MDELQVVLAMLCMIAIVLLVLFAFCHALNIWTSITAWINATREETIGLTRSKGLYNANGYLVTSSSDIHLATTGSFKRFDSVDGDFKITVTTTNFEGDDSVKAEEEHIPPQPLRPAPTSVPTSPREKETPLIVPTLISETNFQKQTDSNIAIPRPRSSMNMTELAAKSHFPICITPPITPSVASSSRNAVSTSSDETDLLPVDFLKRAISCDSICSDSSIALGDLEEANVTGYLCLGLEYDSELSELIVNVLEAKDLVDPKKDDNSIDSYVRIYLLPDRDSNAQTRVCRHSENPSYKERFLFFMHPRDQSQKILCFHVYSMDHLCHTLIGEGELRLNDTSLRQPVTTWITLTDNGQKPTEFGEVMFSLSYLPTAERLTVVVVKARNLRFENKNIEECFIKVYLLQHGKKVHKKKTSIKKREKSPIFNESMIFSVPAHTLQTIQLRITVSEVGSSNPEGIAIGHVIIGAQASGKSLAHWNQMLASLRKPVAMWHPLRR